MVRPSKNKILLKIWLEPHEIGQLVEIAFREGIIVQTGPRKGYPSPEKAVIELLPKLDDKKKDKYRKITKKYYISPKRL